jgi:hypothetical protein
VSSCNFEYGTSPSLGSSVACTQSPTTGSTYVSASLAWLPWSTNYYVRLSATGTAGTSYGAVQTFQTPSPVPSLYTPLPTTTTVGTTYTPYPYPTYTPPPPVSSYPSYRPSSRAAAIARCMRLRGAKRKKCLSALNRRGGGGGRGPKSDNGLSVYYCPYGRTSAARAASILGAGPDVARAASTSEAGWPAKECLKMDKGPAGQHHTIVGMRHVHNWLLGGWGSDTIVGGEKGDVIWGDYQDCCWPSHQTAIIHAGNGRNVIYANDSLNYVWTGTNPKTIVHAHASGIEGVIHCGSSAQVIFLSSVSEKHFKLDHCGRISHYSVGY